MLQTMPLIHPITALVCLMLLALLIILLNVSSLIVTIGSRKTYTSKNYPLLWLLVANILIGLFPLPIYALKKYHFTSIGVTGRICDGWRYTYFTATHLAMVSLLIMTFEKIIRLTYPLRYFSILNKHRVNFILAASWMFFIIFDMIPFFPIDEVDDEFCHYVVKKKWALTMNILTLAIPLPFIVITYSYMIILAYRQAVSIRSMSTSAGNRRRASTIDNLKLAIEVKATRKVAYVVGSYIICWLPSTLYYLIEWLCPTCYPKHYQPHKTWIRFFFKLLVLFHGFVTPILFCWQCIGFRQDAKSFIYRLTGKSVPGSEDYTQSNAVTSFSYNNKSRSISIMSPNAIVPVIEDNQMSERRVVFSCDR